MCSWASRWRRIGSAQPPPARTTSSRSSAVGPIPHSAPPPDSDTRSLPSVTLASAQPWFTSPTRLPAGMRTSVKNTSLKSASPVISRIGRISMPGRSIGQMKYEMPWCLGASGSVRAMRMPNCACAGARRPDLLPVDHPLVAVAHGPGAEVGQVAAGARLAEQLAPDLLAGQQRQQVALLLLLGAGVQDRRARPSRCRSGSAGGCTSARAQLVVDDQLVDRVGVEPPGLRPVRRDVAGLGQLAARRPRVGRQPRPHLDAAGIVLRRQLEVHSPEVMTDRARRPSPPLAPAGCPSQPGAGMAPSCTRRPSMSALDHRSTTVPLSPKRRIVMPPSA